MNSLSVCPPTPPTQSGVEQPDLEDRYILCPLSTSDIAAGCYLWQTL